MVRVRGIGGHGSLGLAHGLYQRFVVQRQSTNRSNGRFQITGKIARVEKLRLQAPMYKPTG